MKWFKFYGQDFLTDSKIGGLHPLQKLMWVALLCVASADEEKTGIIRFLTEERLKELCGISDNPANDDWERTDGTLETFCNMGLVTRPDKDTLIITNYHQRQTQKSTSTERVRDWRAKNKDFLKESSVTRETNVMLQSNGRIDKNRIDKNNTHTSDESEALIEIQGEELEQAEADPETPRSHKVHQKPESEYSNEFMAFWDLFPKKEGKRAAHAVWESIKAPKALQERILKAIELQKNSPQWREDGGRFVPMPSNWLRNRRWEDEVKVGKSRVVDLSHLK